MEAKNLRIGNLVGIQETALHADGCNHLEAIFEIEELKKDVAQFKGFHAGEYYKDLKPIELNEAWLKLYGWKTYAESSVCKGWAIGENPITHDYLLTLTWMKNEDGTLAECFYKNGHFVVKYFHQLQNLFFAITGTELELKHESSTCC